MGDSQGGIAIDREVGARLRGARLKLGLNQTRLAAIGGVSLNTQGRYEAGGTALALDYLRRVAEAGVDWLWVVTGERRAESLTQTEAELLDTINSLTEPDRATLVTIARALAGRDNSAALLSPSQPAIEQALQAFRLATPTNDPDELLHELAMQLPSILRAAAPARSFPSSVQNDERLAPPEVEHVDRHALRQGQRT